MFLNAFIRFCKFGKVRKTKETLANFLENLSVWKKKNYHFTSALYYKDMLRIVKGLASRILIDGFKRNVSISVGVSGGPLGFMRLIRVGILHKHFNYSNK